MDVVTQMEPPMGIRTQCSHSRNLFHQDRNPIQIQEEVVHPSPFRVVEVVFAPQAEEQLRLDQLHHQCTPFVQFVPCTGCALPMFDSWYACAVCRWMEWELWSPCPSWL
jgi:hypothetical protein